VINGNLPLSLQLFYNAMDCGDQQVLGEGWNHNYGVRLIKIKEEELLGIVLEDGRELPYCRKLGNSYAPVMGDGGILSKSENGYRFEREDGTVYEFDQEGRLCSQKDRNGNNRKFTYNSDGLLECVDNGTGGRLNYTYNKERKLIYVEDHTGRKISLKYQYGKLRWFTNSMGNTYTVIWQIKRYFIRQIIFSYFIVQKGNPVTLVVAVLAVYFKKGFSPAN